MAAIADRSNGLHGRNCVLSKSVSKSVSLALTPVRTNEDHICYASFSINLPLLVVCVYHPPCGSKCRTNFSVILISPENLIDMFKGHWILTTGDFNEPHVDWDSISCADLKLSKFLDYLTSCNFKQLIDEPTHIGGSILDLAFSNFDALRWQRYHTKFVSFSDHSLFLDAETELQFEERHFLPLSRFRPLSLVIE